ncbi:CP family cyanate transporter-like MFS transporter [Pullulanibacillus pueri]|uniref:Putative transporter YycB n=1 Tax=Pullulanibacillus pueri TaxID=1437324 RepID=A0A8J2ZTZ6_9BACL|nr:MFS transporter [Pullulanibacillus pueri]MBM7680841.1 CP family cyanate transporter-like MFS transporter [Pullulanibacillus pueri]GGH78538.1 putative transporter YycB [Pullulanibacillus pueri]
MKKPITIFLVMALFFAALNLRPAINSIGPLLQALQKDLGMSASVASLLTTIPVLCMGIFSPVAVKLGSRWGIERVLGWSLFVIGIGTILRFFTTSTTFLLITAFLAGLGIAAMGPLLPGFIKRYFPHQVPTMISVYTVALTLGAALASGLSVPLENGFGSWKGALGIWALLAFIALPIWWFFVLRHREKGTGKASLSQSSKLPWGNKKAWLLTLSFGLMAMIFYSVTAWLPPIIQGLGYSKIYAGNALTLFAFIQIPVSLLLPLLLKRLPSRLLWLLISSVIEIVGFVMILLSIQPIIAAALIGIGAGALFSLNLLLPIDATTNGQEAASWSAMAQAVGYVIGALGPIILGWIQDATGSFFSAVIGLIIIILIMICVQCVAVPRKQHQQSESN